MILVGNARGSASELAAHLMNVQDNEHVELHQLRGFVSDNLHGAMNESHAIAKGTRCTKHLYSLSLNPPINGNPTVADYEAAVDQVENELGLTGQPRAIVFHEKEGRRHCHAVWSRVDPETMTAKQLSFDKKRLMNVSRSLFREHGWRMPDGLAKASERDPKNFSLNEWQQAKRIGKDPRAIKAAFQDAWSVSDSKAAFTHALAERGYHLARGDRRGFVAVDAVSDEVFAIAKWTGQKTKMVRERLGDEDQLPSLTTVRHNIASGMLPTVKRFEDELSAKRDLAKVEFTAKKDQLVQQQRAERTALSHAHGLRHQSEATQRQARFRAGFSGLWDRLRGHHRRIARENEQDAQRKDRRDAEEKHALLTRHRQDRQRLYQDLKATRDRLSDQRKDLMADKQRFEAAKAKPPDRARPDKPAKPRIRVKADARVIKAAPARAAFEKAAKHAPKDDPNVKQEAKPKRTRTPTAEREKRRSSKAKVQSHTPSQAQAVIPTPTRTAFTDAAQPDDRAVRKEAYLRKRSQQATSQRGRKPDGPAHDR